MGTVNLDVPPYDVTGVFTHPDAKVDIVLVHGLNGDPKRTWTSKANNLFWPAELLPGTLGLPPANILVYGYNSKVHGHATDNPIMNHAQTLVVQLAAYRQTQKTVHNPIIWIAHSLGGILTKRALLYSKDITNIDREPLRSIFVSTYALYFLGTPHNGSNLASVGLSLQTLGSLLLPRALFESEPILLRTLQRDSETLKEINNQFLEIYQLFQIHLVHENLKTDLKITKALIVSAESASPQLANAFFYGVEATHSDMCKFSSNTAPGYRVLVTALREWIRKAPAVIEDRWDAENRERGEKYRHDQEARDRLAPADWKQPSVSLERTTVSAGATIETHPETALPRPTVLESGDLVSSPSLISAPQSAPSLLQPALPKRNSDTSTVRPEPFFIIPEKFRPNSYFVGREKELTELHTLLRNPKRSSEGTSAVVIHSLHGGGKTHLAREYFFKHRSDFPGGVCWVRAKSIPEMEQFFWEIAMKGPLHEALNAGGVPQSDMDDPSKIVDIVRKWFNDREHWLIVFDAILFNTPGIERFIPDARYTSIIYTSTQSMVSGNHRFDNPQMLKLGMLRPEHAQELLFRELERTNPSTEDQRLALDLVKHLGCLPLMVHISARHLKETQEPLAKYLKTLRDRSRINPGDLSAYVAVHDELKTRNAVQALNLMYILAYFDNRIPIGFLNLGLQALEISTVAAHDGSTKTRSLTNTLKTLIAFALLERTEANSVSPASSRSSTRRGIKRPSKSVDVLLVHTVVQLFFVSVLHEVKLSEVWIEKSATVYCRAFDEAEDLISKTPQVGLLDDYRCFKTHGYKLLEHLTARMDKKNSSQSALAQLVRAIQERLEKCDVAILRISKDAQKQLVDGLQSTEPVEVGYTIVSVFERANSISDSEDSSRASIVTATGSVSVRSLSPDIPGIASRAPTFDDGERAGPHVRESEYALMSSGFIGGLDSPVEKEPNSATETGAPIQPARPVDKGKQPMTRTPIDPYDDMDGSTIYYQSPEPLPSVTVPGLQRPHPADYRASGGSASYDPHGPQLPDEYEDTETSTTYAPTPHVPNLSPTGTEIYQPQPVVSISHPDLREQVYRPSETNHRTVRKYNGRRYHDSAGAWRQLGAGDPRVTVDYGSAEGSLVRPQFENQATTRTDAENALRALSMASLRSTQASAARLPVFEGSLDPDVPHNQSRSRAQSTGTLGVPLLSIHESYPGLGISQSQQEDDNAMASMDQQSPPVDIKQQKRRSGSPSTFWSSLKRFQRLLPTSRSGASSSPPQQARQEHTIPHIRAGSLTYGDASNGIYENIQDLIDDSPRPFVSGSRTARSSPSQGQGPFQNPPYPVSDTMPRFENRIPPGYAEDYNSRRSHSDLPDPITDWADQTYHPGGAHTIPSDSGFGLVPGHPTNESYPPPFMLQSPTSIGTRPPQRQLLQTNAAAEGYSSQPMSRGASSQSQPESRNSGNLIPKRLSSIPAATGDVHHRRHVRGSSSTSSGNRTRSRPINVPPSLRRNSRSSLVETEPSPRTNDPFDVHTSYRDYEERRQREHLARRLGREGAATQQDLAAGVQTAFQPRLQAIGQGTAMQAGAGGGGPRMVRRAGKPSSAAMSRSQSDSSSIRRPRRGSDSLPAAGAWANRNISPSANQYPMQISTVDGGEYTAEPMSRGASGGSGHGSARSRLAGPGASQHNLPRSVIVDGTGYTSEPMSRGTSGSGHGSAQSRPGAAPRSGRVLQDFGSGQPSEP
ncbi:and nb-arc domain-containing protein [Ophiostoma piceae UAMH 11346]|uniref:And nb-arc domain-containing protein n=1 Tax=Ophiostoma piceae (strain UAMH 11346) TaxID=1262450 RepID=S3CWS0_OPHP1|nr:and nb-arc domain-containing protein [Ophiostoma piceae UAMH 11346]